MKINKKYIGIASIAIILIAALFFGLLKSNSFKGPIEVNGGTLRVKNADLSNLIFQVGDTDHIYADVKSKKDFNEKTRFFSSSGEETTFDFSDYWDDIWGTIIIPEGITLIIEPGKKTNFKINSKSTSSGGSGSITVNSSDISTIQFTEDTIIIESEDDLEAEEDGGGNQYITNPPDDEVESNTEGEDTNSSNEDEDEEGGSGTPSDPEEGCIDDVCCQLDHQDDPTPVCLGGWIYDEAEDDCIYYCPTAEGDIEEPENNNEDDRDTISILCEDNETNEDRSECCNEALKNPISIGPRPGFPDCIGTWQFDEKDKVCIFKCAEHAEMIEILKEIQQQQ